MALIMKIIGIAVLAILIAGVVGLAYLSFTSTTPDVRLVNGRLRSCPPTPNCVSSESNAPHAHVEPLRFTKPPVAAWADLKTSIRVLGGTIVEEQDGFLWATFTSRLFHFVDDMEFRLVAEEGVIQLRSGSRVGRSDLGINSERVKRLRVLFEERQVSGSHGG